MDAAQPQITGADLVGLWNATGYNRAVVICRLLEAMLPTERSAVRRAWLRAAAAFTPGLPPYSAAQRLYLRMVELRSAFPSRIDPQDRDGCLAAALLVDGQELPNPKTIERAIKD